MHSDVRDGHCAVGKPCCWLKGAPLKKTSSKPASVGAVAYSLDHTAACKTAVVCKDCDSRGSDLEVSLDHSRPDPPSSDGTHLSTRMVVVG